VTSFWRSTTGRILEAGSPSAQSTHAGCMFQSVKPNSYLFRAFLKCPTKCYLHSKGQTGTGNAYAEWVKSEHERYRQEATSRLIQTLPEVEVSWTPPESNLKSATWRVAVDLLAARTIESRLHAVERVPSAGRGKPAQFIPIRFMPFNKLTKDDRLLVAFDALALSAVLKREVKLGKIIHGDDQVTLKVKIPGVLSQARKLIEKMSRLLASGEAPDLVLNRRCGECGFRDACRHKAVETDDLSLLGGMSEKERKKLRSKGIFTVTQLSYTFRPRRRPKRLRDRPERYFHSLKALATREKKIHIVGNPELRIEGTPVYLDVEGLPDRDFYYLIGATVETPKGFKQRSFWADVQDDEKTIWADFLSLLAHVQNPVLVHYGSFESLFLKRMCSRHGGPPEDRSSVIRAVEHSINILSFLFAHIYFPTHSNGLKDIGKHIGAKWHASDASGVQSLVWRYQWEASRSEHLKQTLLAYNRDDCQAVYLLTSELQQMSTMAASRCDVDFAYTPKRQATTQGAAIHRIFKTILASAYANYETSRIHVQKEQQEQPESGGPKRTSPIKARKFGVKQARIVAVRSARTCHIHGHTLQPSDQLAQHTMIDLEFTKTGCRKRLTTYVGTPAFCRHCGVVYLPPRIQRLHQQIFARGFMAWVAYQRVGLRLPLGVISSVLFDLFSEHVNVSTVTSLISRVAYEHERTETLIWRQILSSPVIHVDETKVNIRGSIQYVWVFTDAKHVAFRLTATRETQFIPGLLAGYEGTLVSDFYPGYDSVPCSQQKCLVHLIRDLNEDLWKNPFNTEYERFVAAVRDLLVPILEDVGRFGLKAWHLRKHKKLIDRFYQRTIDVPTPVCELIATYQKRFAHYRGSLFTFIGGDEIPWHNNMAERAIRHFAVQRKISGYFFAKGATEYLRLLGIAQTCRFQYKSFLRFLLSDCVDVDLFKQSKRRKPQHN